MATINSIAQARTAKAGTHGVKGKTAPAGISLKKESDALGAGGFNLRFRRGARRPTMGLGPVNAFKNLDEVFEAARDALKLVKQGIDPIAARKREKATNLAAVSFKQAAEAYYADLAPTLKHKYGGPCWINPVRKWAYPVLGQTLLDDITPRLVAAVVRAAAAKGALETGRRVTRCEATGLTSPIRRCRRSRLFSALRTSAISCETILAARRRRGPCTGSRLRSSGASGRRNGTRSAGSPMRRAV